MGKLLLFIVLLVGTGVAAKYWLGISLPLGSKEHSKTQSSVSHVFESVEKGINISGLTLTQKMKLMEKYQKKYKKAANAILDKGQKSKTLDQQYAMGLLEDYTNLSEEYLARFNQMSFPCPKSSKARNDRSIPQSYWVWTRSHERKDEKINEELQKKAQTLMAQAGLRSR